MIIIFMKGGLIFVSRNSAGLLIAGMIALSVLIYDLLFADLLAGDSAQTIGRLVFILIFGGITELYVKDKIIKNN